MTNIVNIDRADIREHEYYFIDTNVWFWFYAAGKGLQPIDNRQEHQIEVYSKFVEDILNSGGKLAHCTLTLAELSNIIERTEHRLYLAYNPDNQINLKRFRNITNERRAVVDEIESAWSTICGLSECLEVNLSEDDSNTILKSLKTSKLDVYDSIYCELAKINKISNLVTDDADFQTAAELNIHTANPRML